MGSSHNLSYEMTFKFSYKMKAKQHSLMSSPAQGLKQTVFTVDNSQLELSRSCDSSFKTFKGNAVLFFENADAVI